MRLTFRLIEFGKGPDIDNPILTNEYYAIGLDALPMLMAFLLLNAVHPGWVLRGPESEFPRMSRKEKKQLKRGKKDAKKEAMNATEAATSANKRGKLPTERHSSTASYEMLEPLDAYTGGSAVNQRDQQ